MIRTKSIYDPVEAADGLRILVMRWLPKRFVDTYTASGISAELSLYAWYLLLAPSVGLLTDYQRGVILWEEYVRRYIQEMLHPDCLRVMRELADLDRDHKVLTLLCAEAESNPRCHRHILKQLILAVESGKDVVDIVYEKQGD